MDNKTDIQSQTDTRNVTIDRVGVKNIQYPIVVEDRSNRIQHTTADLDIYVQLPHTERGTHMSRFIEVLNRYHEETFINDLKPFLEDIKESLNAKAAFTKIRFPYFVRKKAPVSGIESLLSYRCIFEASCKEGYELMIGVEVPVTTLCPCSKEISEYGAHNQRSMIRIKVSYQDFIWLEELIEYAESAASCEIFSLLKRVDEKYVTEKAFDNPRFVEDVIREMTLKLQSDERITYFRVEAENMESIHNHNAYAFVERRLER